MVSFVNKLYQQWASLQPFQKGHKFHSELAKLPTRPRRSHSFSGCIPYSSKFLACKNSIIFHLFKEALKLSIKNLSIQWFFFTSIQKTLYTVHVWSSYWNNDSQVRIQGLCEGIPCLSIALDSIRGEIFDYTWEKEKTWHTCGEHREYFERNCWHFHGIKPSLTCYLLLWCLRWYFCRYWTKWRWQIKFTTIRHKLKTLENQHFSRVLCVVSFMCVVNFQVLFYVWC